MGRGGEDEVVVGRKGGVEVGKGEVGRGGKEVVVVARGEEGVEVEKVEVGRGEDVAVGIG